MRINTVRVSSYVQISKVDFDDIQPFGKRMPAASIARRQCDFVGEDSPIETPVYDDVALEPGTTIDGPAVITTAATTYLVEQGWNFHASNHGAVWFTRID